MVHATFVIKSWMKICLSAVGRWVDNLPRNVRASSPHLPCVSMAMGRTGVSPYLRLLSDAACAAAVPGTIAAVLFAMAWTVCGDAMVMSKFLCVVAAGSRMSAMRSMCGAPGGEVVGGGLVPTRCSVRAVAPVASVMVSLRRSLMSL